MTDTPGTGGSTHRVLAVAQPADMPDDEVAHHRDRADRAEAALEALRAQRAAELAATPRRRLRVRAGRGTRPTEPQPPNTSASDGGSKGSTDQDGSQEPNSQESPRPAPEAEQPTGKPRGGYFARRYKLVATTYDKRREDLEVFRGPAVAPAFTRWYHLLKPRLILMNLVFFLNVVDMVIIWTAKRPIWCFIPRPGLLERGLLAIRTIRGQQFSETKFIAVFSLKGGVGKTTLTLLLAMVYRWIYTTLPTLVADNNLDSGTLGTRIKRNNTSSMKEAIEEVEKITSLAILQSYCSYLKSGLLIMVMGDWKIETKAQLEALHTRFKEFLGLVFSDLGTSTISPSNQVALDDAHQVVIATTPARDSISQAAKSLLELIESDDEHLVMRGRTAIITINRWHLLARLTTSPRKLRHLFLQELAEHSGLTGRFIKHYEELGGVVDVEPENPTDQYHQEQQRRRFLAHKRAKAMALKVLLRDPQQQLARVRFTLVGNSLWLALGRRVTLRLVSPGVLVQLLEINAMAALNMSDNYKIARTRRERSRRAAIDAASPDAAPDTADSSSTDAVSDDTTDRDIPDQQTPRRAS